MQKRTEPYGGPLPRKRHSHKCLACVERGHFNAVACYKSACRRPQVTETCSWCQHTRWEDTIGRQSV